MQLHKRPIVLTVGNPTSPAGPGHSISRHEKLEYLREALYIPETD
jgi:hypothetical protein